MKLLLDACVASDLILAEIAYNIFDLKADIAVTEFVHRELDPWMSERSQMEKLGLSIARMDMNEVMQANKQWPGGNLSNSDRSCLHVAERESRILLTHDKAMIKQAKLGSLKCYHTLWIIDKMRLNGTLDAMAAVNAIKSIDSRPHGIPSSEIARMLKTLEPVTRQTESP